MTVLETETAAETIERALDLVILDRVVEHDLDTIDRSLRRLYERRRRVYQVDLPGWCG
jgi:hypothetical protein